MVLRLTLRTQVHRQLPLQLQTILRAVAGLLGGLPLQGLPTHGLPVNGLPLG